MAQKTIAELQLIESVSESLNFPVHDSIQTYRATSAQIKSFILGNGNITRAMLAQGAVARMSIRAVSSADTAQATDDVILCDPTSGPFTETLFTAVGVPGRIIQISNVGSANIVTVDGNSSETIYGLETVDLFPGEQITLLSDGSNWQIYSSYSGAGKIIELTGTIAPSTTTFQVTSGIQIPPGRWNLKFSLLPSENGGSSTNGVSIYLSTGNSTSLSEQINARTRGNIAVNSVVGGMGTVYENLSLTSQQTFYGKTAAYGDNFASAAQYKLTAKRL